jgi:hypothetical protein
MDFIQFNPWKNDRGYCASRATCDRPKSGLGLAAHYQNRGGALEHGWAAAPAGFRQADGVVKRGTQNKSELDRWGTHFRAEGRQGLTIGGCPW